MTESKKQDHQHPEYEEPELNRPIPPQSNSTQSSPRSPVDCYRFTFRLVGPVRPILVSHKIEGLFRLRLLVRCEKILGFSTHGKKVGMSGSLANVTRGDPSPPSRSPAAAWAEDQDRDPRVQTKLLIERWISPNEWFGGRTTGCGARPPELPGQSRLGVTCRRTDIWENSSISLA